MSVELLRRAAQRLDIRCLTVNPDAHVNPVEVEKWREEWTALAAWLRDCAVVIEGRPLQLADQAFAVARAILGEQP